MRISPGSKGGSSDEAAIRILLVTDQEPLAATVLLALGHGGFVTKTASNMSAATSTIPIWRPDVVLADLAVEGASLLGELYGPTAAPGNPPLLAFVRVDDLKTRMAAFQLGAHDVVAVPFSVGELLFRIALVIGRTHGTEVELRPSVNVPGLEIDIFHRRVVVAGSQVHLTSAEMPLLYLFVANAGRLLSRDEIEEALWGENYLADSNMVDQHVRSLRRKLHDDWRRPRYIATVRGKGYRFLPQSMPLAEAPVGS